MFYRIKPLDTLFFRDGRPFTMGAETWANLIFPPYPTTVYGSIRSWLIFEKGNLKDFENGKFESELGTPNNKGSLKITGVFIELNDILRFPIPKDLLEPKKNNKILSSIDLIQRPKIFISDYDLDYILVNKSDEKLDEAKGFLDSKI